MPVSEERFTDVLTTRRPRGDGLSERNPVAALLIEGMAVSHRGHEQAIREAGTFVLDLLGASEPDGCRLTLPVAMQVLSRDEARPAEEMHHYLLQTAQRDLLLGIAVHALVGQSPGRWKRRHAQRRREVVIRTLYLLLRMVETQEHADDLDRQVWSS